MVTAESNGNEWTGTSSPTASGGGELQVTSYIWSCQPKAKRRSELEDE